MLDWPIWYKQTGKKIDKKIVTWINQNCELAHTANNGSLTQEDKLNNLVIISKSLCKDQHLASSQKPTLH